MLKTKRNSPGSESKFGAKKKRHLKKFKTWFILESVIETPVAVAPTKRRNKKRLIRNVSEAIKMSAKGLYKRAHNAETPEERQQYIEWARARTRWEFEVGIRKLPPRRTVAA